jgi:eukaryotic-like serine/threonine-protein kinase
VEHPIAKDKVEPAPSTDRMVGRCEMFDEIAAGATARIHLGRMLGAESFSRTVAIKRLHPQYALNPEFVAAFLDEARIVARIRHPNVVPILDLVEEEGDLFIIMEYIEGINFGQLCRAAQELGERVPPGVAARTVAGALTGLHAAHEATNEKGHALGVVHRDVSPENILVGVDGFPRMLDFGVARARGRVGSSRSGQLKGHLSFMAPEQLLAEPLDRRTDVFAASIVLYQALTGLELFAADDIQALKNKLLEMPIEAPSKVVPGMPRKFDAIVLRGLERKPARRWKSAQDMAEALEAVGGLAPQREVGEWVRRLGAARLAELATKVSALEVKPVAKRPKSDRRVHQRSQLRIPVDELKAAAARAEAELADEARAVRPSEGSGEVPVPVAPALARRSGEYRASDHEPGDAGTAADEPHAAPPGAVPGSAQAEPPVPSADAALASGQRRSRSFGTVLAILGAIALAALVAWRVLAGLQASPGTAATSSDAASTAAPPSAGASSTVSTEAAAGTAATPTSAPSALGPEPSSQPSAGSSASAKAKSPKPPPSATTTKSGGNTGIYGRH